ncbi:MAG: ribonuclease J, partial [Candidatus Roizmanbacteria bacterium]
MASNEYKVRVLPLGGVTNVTMNMYLYELYKGDDLQDILIVDCGIGFPKEKDLGVELVIPDITYLQDKKDKIRAVLLTHGHEDHISALKFHYASLGNPPVYGSRLTAGFVEGQFAEKKIPLRVNQIAYNTIYTFGGFTIYYIHVTHSIPDTTHIVLKSPVGTFYHGSDYKLDLTPPYGNPPDFYAINKAGKEGVRCLLTDCLGVERSGITLSESAVGQTFEEAMRTTKGMFIMSTFSSNISRINQCVEAAIKFNRKICFLGRSMRQNTDLARRIGYLPEASFKLQIRENQLKNHKPSSVCVICTGSQGQSGAALARISTGEHKYVHVEKGDKVLFSSDPIPGNEDEVFEIIEKLYAKGAEVVYSQIQEDLHASGHASREEMKYLLRF